MCRRLKLENARIKDEEREQIREEEARSKAEAEEAASAARAAAQRDGKTSAQDVEPTTAAAAATPSTPARPPPVDLLALTSQLLSLVHGDMERAQAIREKAQQLKEKRAEAAAAEEGADESAATEHEAAEEETPPSFTSKMLSSFLDSKVQSLLRDIDTQLGGEQVQQTDAPDEATAASEPESDGALLQWIEQTLAARDVHVTDEQAQRLLRMLKAMCEHDGLPLTHTTLARLTRLTQPHAHDKEQSKRDADNDKSTK